MLVGKDEGIYVQEYHFQVQAAPHTVAAVKGNIIITQVIDESHRNRRQIAPCSSCIRRVVPSLNLERRSGKLNQ